MDDRAEFSAADGKSDAMDPSSAFVAAIESIYAAAAAPDLWPAALHAIARCLDSAGALIMWKHGDGSFGAIASPGFEALLRAYHEEGWNRRDSPGRRVLERLMTRPGDALSDIEIATREELDQDPFYSEYMARYGVRHRAATAILPAPSAPMIVSVHRALGRPPLDRADTGMLSRLGRHVENAFRLSMRLADAEIERVGLEASLDRIGIGVFAVDAQSRVVFSNSAGRAFLGRGLVQQDGRLTPASREDREALDGALRQAIETDSTRRTGKPKPLWLRSGEAGRPFAVYVLPVCGRDAFEQSLARARAFVLLVQTDREGAVDPSLLRDALGLTLGEARVAAHIGLGRSPREAAQELGLTETTARSVLKQVFAKVGVSRQNQLAAIIARLPPS